MPTIANLFGQSATVAHEKEKGNYAVPLRMGIEVEIEGFRGHVSESVGRVWNAIPDHSLRDGGIEFVLRSPLYGVHLEKAIAMLHDVLNNGGFSLSHRCSVHVHIDFRDTEVEKVENFLLLYMLLEPALYTISSKDRYNNIYCPGLSHTTDLIKTAAIGFAANDITRLINTWNKYTGINLCPLSTLGSVEIRTHSGTGNGTDILEWTQILNCLYAAAMSMSIEEINKVSSPQELLDRVFPEDLIPKLMCDNLLVYWNSAKLNLLYYNLISTVLEDNRTSATLGLSDDRLTNMFIRRT